MKNQYEAKDETTTIYVIRKGVLHTFLIDTEDLTLVSDFQGTWHLNNRGYVSRTVKGKRESLHRLIMNPADSTVVVDHIDGNPLNNRKNNLRIITWDQNAQNISSNRRSITGVRGVSLDNRWGERWRARIRVNGKDINLGYYDTKEEAEEAVKKGRAEFLPFSKEAANKNI